MAGIRILVASMVTVMVGLAVVGPAHAAKPAPPAGVTVLSPGQLPHACTASDTSTSGTYYDTDAEQWMTAPLCYAVWGNLEMSAPQLANAGTTVSMTATPNQGSNSATYAPETKSISWTVGGSKVVSGCGNADLSCSFIPAAKPAEYWQWVPINVTMPRTFFIDSRGSNCAGQHICAGFATNAYSWVGVRPASLTPGILRGRVVDSDGDPMPGVRVSATGPSSKTASTGANGRYEMTFKKAGRYTVRASNGAGAFTPRSDAVQIRKASTSTANFKLAGCSAKKAKSAFREKYVGRTTFGRFAATWDDCSQDVTITVTGGSGQCTDGVGADTGDPTSPPLILGDTFGVRFDGAWAFKATPSGLYKAEFSYEQTSTTKLLGRLEPDGTFSPLPGITVSGYAGKGTITRKAMRFEFDMRGGGTGPGGRTVCEFSSSSMTNNKVELAN